MNSQNIHKILVSNTTEDCEKLTAFVKHNLEPIDIPEETYNDIRLFIEEIFVNIVNYAYKENRKGSINLELYTDDGAIHFTFIDSGIAFNPLMDSKKDLNSNDKCEGGMGITLIKSLTDNQEYKRIEQRNVFTVTKNYTQQQ